jgi:hypothetical protein
LESEYTARYRGFESHPLRLILKIAKSISFRDFYLSGGKGQPSWNVIQLGIRSGAGRQAFLF